MSTEENKATVRRAIEEGWNQGNVAVFDELNAPNFIYHDPGAPDVRTTGNGAGHHHCSLSWRAGRRSLEPGGYFGLPATTRPDPCAGAGRVAPCPGKWKLKKETSIVCRVAGMAFTIPIAKKYIP